VADLLRKNSSNLRDPPRGGPCLKKTYPDWREGSTAEMTHPQVGLDASVTWDLVRLDFYLTRWFEFIESGAP